MNRKLEKAVEIFKREGAGNVIYREGEDPILSNEKGIKPFMVQLRRNRKAFLGAAVADKVIGKAAAWMAVLGEAESLYGEKMSEGAIDILKQAGISYAYGELVPFIENRTRDGKCPLEEAVWDITDAETAFDVLEQKIAWLMRAKQEQE